MIDFSLSGFFLYGLVIGCFSYENIDYFDTFYYTLEIDCVCDTYERYDTCSTFSCIDVLDLINSGFSLDVYENTLSYICDFLLIGLGLLYTRGISIDAINFLEIFFCWL